MVLYYINLGLDYDEYAKTENELRYDFQLNTRFISNYFSKEIRKLKFKTDGTFNMLSINLTELNAKSSKIIPPKVLQILLPFDRNKYSEIKGTFSNDYYLSLLEEGFKKASDFKKIPFQELTRIMKDFKNGGCKNEWIELKKKFKADDLEIILKSEFTTNYYQVIATINQISTKKELVSGIIIRTEPDEIIFDKLTKAIDVGNEIIIKDKFDNPVVEIIKRDVFEGKLNFNIIMKNEYFSLSYLV